MEYAKCLTQLNEVINHLGSEYFEKIPLDVKNTIAEQMDKNYIWNYDETKELNEQRLDRKTIVMLSCLNMDYLLNEEQKKLMEEYHKVNEMKAIKRIPQNSNDFFYKENGKKENEKTENVSMANAVAPKWYEKIILFIKKIIKKRKF